MKKPLNIKKDSSPILNKQSLQKVQTCCCFIFLDEQLAWSFLQMLFFFRFSLVFFKVDHTVTDTKSEGRPVQLSPIRWT